MSLQLESSQLVESTNELSAEFYVQFGCGLAAPRQWTNYDSSPTLRWERVPILGKLATKNAYRFPPNVKFGDIVRGLPVPAGGCRGVYASHVLEHLTLSEFHAALSNTRKLLRAGGIVRLIVPDLEWAAREYVKRLDEGDSAANEIFLDETCLGVRSSPKGPYGLVHKAFSTHSHRWMWDRRSLVRALTDHGYRQIRHCSFGDCEDPMFALVEDLSRFQNAVAVEARA